MSGPAWLLLAIVSEVIATTALRASDGLSRPLPVVFVVAGYALAFGALSRALMTLPLGLSYAVWSALGTVGALAAGWVIYGERLGWTGALGVTLVVLGTALLTGAGHGHG